MYSIRASSIFSCWSYLIITVWKVTGEVFNILVGHWGSFFPIVLFSICVPFENDGETGSSELDPLGPFPDQDHLIGEFHFDILGLWHYLQTWAAHSCEVVGDVWVHVAKCQELGHWSGGQLNAVAEKLCWCIISILGNWHLISFEHMCPGILHCSCEPAEGAG